MDKRNWPNWAIVLNDSLRTPAIYPRPTGTTVHIPRAWVTSMRLSGMPPDPRLVH
jgi:hypothetical protein